MGYNTHHAVDTLYRTRVVYFHLGACSGVAMSLLSCHRIRITRSTASALLGVVAVAAFSGCANYDPAANARLFARVSVPVQRMPAGEHMRSAERQAGGSADTFVVVGSGHSMEPVYPHGTALVVRERSYKNLRPGMGVVYRNARGLYVAHMVVEHLPRGWIAIGLNSQEPDDELVTQKNFIGVITAAFVPYN